VQTCILLGSHHVYHGRPSLSFALLGATIKISNAIGLHRGHARGSPGDVQERKRVWWTIYTWDRYVRTVMPPWLSSNGSARALEKILKTSQIRLDILRAALEH
jgi:hypothetical protein